MSISNEQRIETRTILEVWVICKHPLDFPEHYTLRAQWAMTTGVFIHHVCGLYNTLEEARFDVPEGLAYFPPWEGDDYTIVETYL